MRHNKLNKRQRKEDQRQQLKNHLQGDGGVYLYENNTSGDIFLPKPMLSGATRVPKGGKFQGDSYFKGLVKTGELKLVKTVLAPPPCQYTPKPILENNKEEPILEEQEMADKLILDQPDTFSEEGKIEHVVVPKGQQKLNEQGSKDQDKEPILLNEDPMDGVEIIV